MDKEISNHHYWSEVMEHRKVMKNFMSCKTTNTKKFICFIYKSIGILVIVHVYPKEREIIKIIVQKKQLYSINIFVFCLESIRLL